MSQEGLLSIEAGSTTIRLSKPMLGSLVSIIDRNTGHDFLRPTAEPAPMWEALLATPAGKKTLSSKHADQFEVETSKSHRHGKKLRLTWSHFPEPFGEAKATADVEFISLDSQIEFRMTEFDPGRENGVWQLDFPIIGGVDEIRTNGRGDKLSVPLLQGLLVHNPLKTIVSNERVKRTLHGTYPGLLTMQFFAYYNEEVAGLYLATHDALGYRKDFLFDAGDDQREVSSQAFSREHWVQGEGLLGRLPDGSRDLQRRMAGSGGDLQEMGRTSGMVQKGEAQIQNRPFQMGQRDLFMGVEQRQGRESLPGSHRDWEKNRREHCY